MYLERVTCDTDRMRITIVGASGRIGSRATRILTGEGHEVVAASRSSGVDSFTGAGLASALAGSGALIDLTNARASDDEEMEFFTRSATNLAKAAGDAGVGHCVMLSIVGVEGVPDSGHYRAKVAQERVYARSGLPYTIVRSTQFDEFTDAIVDSLTVDGEVRVPDALIQPVPAEQAAAAVARAALGQPANGVLTIAGPVKMTFESMARDVLARRGDRRTRVVVDPDARYFGARLARDALVVPD